MTLAQYMMGQFSKAQYVDFFLRLLVACLCGAAIGFERSLRFKEAGIRTHIIVCFASSLMMIVSKYGFVDMTDIAGNAMNGSRGADVARIAAQVVSGISFLGAGIIFRSGTSIRGLTTAAGIWATAGIGLAIGSGLYIIGVFSTVVIALLQIIMHKHTLSADSLVIGKAHCKVKSSELFHTKVNNYIREHNVQIISSKITLNDDGSSTYDLTFRMNQHISIYDLSEFLESIDGVRELSCEVGN